MKVVIVFNHPYKNSFCNAVLQSVQIGLQQAGHTIDIMHLDDDNFDPVMRAKDLEAFVKSKYEAQHSYDRLDKQVLDYKQRLEAADHLIFIFPVWWELMPALTKGFIDKVIFPGVAYEYANTKGTKMVSRVKNIKGLTVITTMNTPSILYRLVFGNAVKKAIFTGTFWKLGFPKRKWISLNMVKFVSDAKRKKWLIKLERDFARLK
ncbi:MAG: NAD(P)H-dependent oxidoreductase [Bacteroidetes bacterium]|nr:NAD(P)H-dependent oxidoreductase [Bacteroidota bacterium]